MRAFRERLDTALRSISEIGAELIKDGDRIFTYSISSTVWGIFRRARAQGKSIEVVVTESRPGNEGLWNIAELGKDGIPVTVGIDAAMGTLMRGCAMFIVGSDGITSSGGALCKIGSYPAAAVARDLGIPVRIAADTSKFDPLSLLGFGFKIREMPTSDITQDTASNLTVRNPVFDVTPPHLITEIITERGIISPSAAYVVFAGLQQSPRLSEKLRTWVRQKA
jgi:ribose 1,5-bisphosphate isomerase